MEDRDRSDGSQKTKSGLINSSSKKIRHRLKQDKNLGVFFLSQMQTGEGGTRFVSEQKRC